jgi:FKBP-type peptidyl-prolyl cis-trans isomerase FkpA
MRVLVSIMFLVLGQHIYAASKDSTFYYDLPDSVKAVSLIADISIQSVSSKNETYAGIKTSEVNLVLEVDGKEKDVEFRFPKSALIVATGIDVDKEKDELEWEYDWKLNTTYKLLIASAGDSAGNFVLYSGYIFLPEENKWKLIGTCKISGKWSSLTETAKLFSNVKQKTLDHKIDNVWVQRSAGSWKKLDETNNDHARPIVNPMINVDSVRQYQLERDFLAKAIASGKTDVTNDTAGIYYKIIDAGTGKVVSVTDTVTVYYKLRIFGTTDIIDQASDKPATFPLNRLIKAWQIAVPLVRTGGKLKIVIPSGFAYSIRTRAAKIPPNSILEFDIEVIGTKPATR